MRNLHGNSRSRIQRAGGELLSLLNVDSHSSHVHSVANQLFQVILHVGSVSVNIWLPVSISVILDERDLLSREIIEQGGLLARGTSVLLLAAFVLGD